MAVASGPLGRSLGWGGMRHARLILGWGGGWLGGGGVGMRGGMMGGGLYQWPEGDKSRLTTEL